MLNQIGQKVVAAQLRARTGEIQERVVKNDAGDTMARIHDIFKMLPPLTIGCSLKECSMGSTIPDMAKGAQPLHFVRRNSLCHLLDAICIEDREQVNDRQALH